MSVRTRLCSLEGRQRERDQGHCPHGIDIVDLHEPERPARRCAHCGRFQQQIVIREDQSGLPWSPQGYTQARSQPTATANAVGYGRK